MFLVPKEGNLMSKRLLSGVIAGILVIVTLTGCNTILDTSSAFECEEFAAFGEYSDISSTQDPITDFESDAPKQQDPMSDPEISAPERQDPNSDPAIDTPEYNNTLNIGEIEVAEDGVYYFYNIPPLFEMSREEVLEHFGLSVEFDLSVAVSELCEVMPKHGIFNMDGKHGLHRVEHSDLVWEEVAPMWDHDQFEFESADGSHTAKVIFQRKYSNLGGKYDNGTAP